MIKKNMQSEQKRVSIIIPCYNNEAYIRESIDSALCQTYPNIEVIVIDDGSTDGSYEVMKSYQSQIKMLQQKNAGPSAARNTGILNSGGDYLLFLDGDDILMPEAVESKMKIMLSDESIGIVSGAFYAFDETGVLPGLWSSEHLAKQKNPFIQFVLTPSLHCGPLYRKSVFADCGLYDPSLESSEDLDMMLRCLVKYKMGFDEKPLSLYRRFNENTRSRDILRCYKAHTKIFLKNSTIAPKKFQYYLYSQFNLSKYAYLAYTQIKESQTLRLSEALSEKGLSKFLFRLHLVTGCLGLKPFRYIRSLRSR
jgi:glycosyltransferase involved in cell wall biosynthesis